MSVRMPFGILSYKEIITDFEGGRIMAAILLLCKVNQIYHLSEREAVNR